MIDALEGDHESVENSLLIAEKCDLDFGESNYKLPILDEEIKYDGIREFANKSLFNLINNNIISSADLDIYQERVDHEVSIIEKMGFEGYFMVVSDFINYAK